MTSSARAVKTCTAVQLQQTTSVVACCCHHHHSRRCHCRIDAEVRYFYDTEQRADRTMIQSTFSPPTPTTSLSLSLSLYSPALVFFLLLLCVINNRFYFHPPTTTASQRRLQISNPRCDAYAAATIKFNIFFFCPASFI